MITGYSIHSGSTQGRTSKQIATTHNDTYLHAYSD